MQASLTVLSKKLSSHYTSPGGIILKMSSPTCVLCCCRPNLSLCTPAFSRFNYIVINTSWAAPIWTSFRHRALSCARLCSVRGRGWCGRDGRGRLLGPLASPGESQRWWLLGWPGVVTLKSYQAGSFLLAPAAAGLGGTCDERNCSLITNKHRENTMKALQRKQGTFKPYFVHFLQC